MIAIEDFPNFSLANTDLNYIPSSNCNKEYLKKKPEAFK